MAREVKSTIQLKRDYWLQQEYVNEAMIEALINRYGEKSVSLGESIYIVKQRTLDILSVLPLVGRFIK